MCVCVCARARVRTHTLALSPITNLLIDKILFKNRQIAQAVHLTKTRLSDLKIRQKKKRIIEGGREKRRKQGREIKQRKEEREKRKKIGRTFTSLEVKYWSLGLLWLYTIDAPFLIFQNFILGVKNLRSERLFANYLSSKLLIKTIFYPGAELSTGIEILKLYIIVHLWILCSITVKKNGAVERPVVLTSNTRACSKWEW